MGFFDFIFRRNNSSTLEEKLKEWNKAAKEESDKYQKIHDKNINSFNYRKLKNVHDTSLSCVEKSFLKYVCGRTVQETNIAGYWTHSYNIKYSYVMSKFFKLGLLDTKISLKKCTVKVLKEILRGRGIPLNGKKNDLISRLGENPVFSEVEMHLLEQYRIYSLTPSGETIVASVVDSITKDPEIEDKTLELIQIQDFDAAFDVIAKWQASKNSSQGIGINWHTTKLSETKRKEYTKIFSEYSDHIVASCKILCDMLGMGSRELILLLKRFNKYTPPPPREILFTEEVVGQHRKAFLSYLKDTLHKEKFTVEIEEKYGGIRIYWRRYPIGQIGFSKYGHTMQWIEGAYVPNTEVKDPLNEVVTSCGNPVTVENLSLQDCLEHINYWIQYINVLIATENIEL